MSAPSDIRSRILLKKFAVVGKTPANTKLATTKQSATKQLAAKQLAERQSAFTCSPEYKLTVSANAHLGKKGYTIPKSVLSPDDLAFLKRDLFMRPVVAGGVSYGGDAAQDTAFPVYRENENKMYIPRFYGVDRYGLPAKSDIEDGVGIVVPFDKPLRDYQNNIVDIYVKHVNASTGGGAILEVPCGRGKCLAKDTPVLMYNGMVQMVQDIGVGEFIMGDDSRPRRVISLARGRERMVRIRETRANSFSGESYTVNRSHILSLHRRGHPLSNVVDISVADFLELSPELRAEYRGFRVAVEFPRMYPDPVDIAPYDMGVWLTSPITNSFEHLHMKSYRMWSYDSAGAAKKRMPEQYKYGSREIRSEMMSGIFGENIRGNGLGNKLDNCLVVIDDPGLFADVVFVARSLGYGVYINNATTMMVDLSPETLDYTFEIDELEEDAYYGFELTGNRRFVLGDMTVTHNTVMALKIISVLQKKTLILVHKEFLMNQWVERIAEFLPTATVGKIQGPTFDVAGRDIVIGMIQSLYDKDYGANAFTEFGLTVIDEVHRIGSEQFSKTLLKILTRYMLGISATVDRKDGMTKVLNMFIGPKIYSEEREHTDPVCVRAIEYVSLDPDFNEVEYDFRGKPKHSTMLSKLSNYVPRSEFIVRILADLVREHPENQIMVLGHQRALLTYFYEEIRARGMAGGSVGFYVGGMKEESLKTTETMRIVLATYAMAAEALDIKSLATLVMVSPKTDIVQSVGRILRIKHEHPIIVDVVDKHDLFQNQWFQRRRYYKKCGYRIRQIDSGRYSGMTLDWKTDKTWRWVHEPVAGCLSEADEPDEVEDGMVRTCLLDTSSMDFETMEYA